MAERRMMGNEALLASIVACSDDAIISKSPEGFITSWNPAAERLFGYSAQEAIGQPLTMLIPRERYDEEPVILARIARGEATDHFETVRVGKNGRPCGRRDARWRPNHGKHADRSARAGRGSNCFGWEIRGNQCDRHGGRDGRADPAPMPRAVLHD